MLPSGATAVILQRLSSGTLGPYTSDWISRFLCVLLQDLNESPETTAHVHAYIKTYMNSDGQEPRKEHEESLFSAKLKEGNGELEMS